MDKNDKPQQVTVTVKSKGDIDELLKSRTIPEGLAKALLERIHLGPQEVKIYTNIKSSDYRISD